MINKTWQSIKNSFQDQKSKPGMTVLENGEVNLPSLTDADFEFLLNQLLEGVVNGWEAHRVEKFFQQLDERAQKEQWLSWLERYDARVTSVAKPDKILGRRLLLLQQQTRSLPKLKEISTITGNIGRELLNPKKDQQVTVTHTPVWEYEGPDAPEKQQAIDIEIPSNLAAGAVSVEELAERLETDPNLRHHIAQELGIDENTDAKIMINSLLAQAKTEQPTEPIDADGWFQQGLELAESAKWEEALRCWDKVLEVNPDSQQAWYNRGGTLMMMQDFTEAVASYSKSLEKHPEDFEGWFHRGICLNNLERYEDAIASYDQALEIKPDYWHPWIHRGLAVHAVTNTENISTSTLAENTPSLKQRGYEGAVATYREALTHIDPQSQPEGWGRLHWVIAVAHAQTALKQPEPSLQWQEAVSHYNEALKSLTEDKFPQAHLEILKNLIYAYQSMGETETAAHLQEKGAELAQRLHS